MNPIGQILPLTETVTPADEAAVAEVVREAWKAGTPVYPIGGGTNLRYGPRPTKPGLDLSLARLSGVIDYPARDLTITVEAGITIGELARRLASGRQRLPVDVPHAKQATVGGVVATSPSGPRRYHWGTMRDYCIGLRAIDGRGTAFSGGARVVKNAAGYDLCRLLTGSLGTLGVITQVTLMVKATPETSALVACEVADFDAAERLLAELVRSQTLPAAIELVVGPVWQEDPVLGSGPDRGAGRLVVGFEGTRAEVDWMVGRLEEEWRALGMSSPVVIRGTQAGRLWDRLTDSPVEKTAPDGPPPVVVEIRTLPGAVADTAAVAREVDPGCSIHAHAGDGIVRVRLSMEPKDAAAAIQRRLRPAAAAQGGSAVVVSAPQDGCFDQRMIWGPAVDGANVMQAIKDQFDPKGILNPGRFIFS